MKKMNAIARIPEVSETMKEWGETLSAHTSFSCSSIWIVKKKVQCE